ncbi:hypothetical protein [Bacillus timonensis]|uniref:hypothetical protein n=1 Tax=Bacillus timonensis TaxID=1033734 RepID=UPI001F5F3423|nr:hypothetical protein [Bacillus timonensis]
MDLQLVEAYVPDKFFNKVDESLKEFPHVSFWISIESKDRTLIRVLVKTADTEEILDYLEGMAHVIEGFEVLLFPVQTYITRLTEEEKEQRLNEEEENANKLERASRQEL